MIATSYHLRPRRGWLNDPNAVTQVAGRWHVFFQHTPDAPRHAQIAWGHATSVDLATWQLEPVAFRPTPGGPDAAGCWSGVYLPGHDRPGVAYSGVQDRSGQSTVCLRWGSPDLRDWDDPIVVARTPGQVTIMRDPYLLEYQGRRLAILGAELPGAQAAVLLYDRDDELHWRYQGTLVADDPVMRAAGPADIWECPQLFPLEGRWVLVVSLHHRGVLGAVVAAVGELATVDGQLRFQAEAATPIDTGSDLYAPQVSLADGEPLLIGWIREPDQDPAVRDQAGCLSLPRRLRLAGTTVVSQVDPGAATALRGQRVPTRTGDIDLTDRRWSLTVTGPGAALRHPVHGLLPVAAGDQIWVDGPVVELYHPAAAASTWRHDQPWRLELNEPAAVEICEVRPRTP